MFFELRQYRIKKGKMKQWVKYAEDVLLPFQISQGMVIVGTFVGQEEEDLFGYLFIDASASMAHPKEDAKYRAATALALALCYVILSSGDSVPALIAIRSSTARRGDFFSNSTAYTSLTIGISTRCRRAS